MSLWQQQSLSLLFTGSFSYEFARYEEAPKDICDKEVEKAKAMREAEKDE